MKRRIKLPDDFFLGAAASAWQTEGWTGKKEHQDSYIDLWYKENKDVWHNGYGPAIATDYYHRYQEDIDLMAECGLDWLYERDWHELLSNITQLVKIFN